MLWTQAQRVCLQAPVLTPNPGPESDLTLDQVPTLG